MYILQPSDEWNKSKIGNAACQYQLHYAAYFLISKIHKCSYLFVTFRIYSYQKLFVVV